MKDHQQNPWKTLSSKLEYNNQWISVTEHQVINPSGNPGIYGVVHFKNIAIAVIPLDEEYNTWIVGQYRFPLHSYEWEVTEGGCPEGEDPIEAAQRELIEEVGLMAEKFEMILSMQLSNSVSDEISYSYVATGLKFVGSNPEDAEELLVRKLPFEEVFQMAMRGEIKDGLSVASILKVKILIDEGKI